MKRWLYPLLLAAQTAGAAMILWNGIPVYRQILNDPSKHEPRPERKALAILAVAMIQSAYWLRVRLGLMPQWRGNLLFGHLVSFAARLSFIFGAASFSLVFFARLPELRISAAQVALLLAVLFSLFCYMLELERLAKASLEQQEKY